MTFSVGKRSRDCLSYTADLFKFNNKFAKQKSLFDQLLEANSLEVGKDLCYREDFNAQLLRDRDQRTSFKFSPADEAFFYKRYALAEYYLSLGGAFHARELKSIVQQPFLFFEFPYLSEALCEAKLHYITHKPIKDGFTHFRTPIELFNFVLIEACHKGNLRGIEWACKKLREFQVPINKVKVDVALKVALNGGFEQVVDRLHKHFDLSKLEENQKRSYLELCFECGFTHLIPSICEKMQLVLSDKEGNRLQDMIPGIKRYREMYEKEFSDSIPELLDGKDNQIQGYNEKSRNIYRNEYMDAVAFAAYFINKQGMEKCNFSELIKHLAARCRRIAALGNLSPLDSFGDRQAGGCQITTYLGKDYAAQGHEHSQKFMYQFNGEEMFRLTTLKNGYAQRADAAYYDHIHLYPLHTIPNYETPSAAIVRLISKICMSDDYEKAINEMSKSYWLFMHAAPYKEGNAMIFNALCDAILLEKGMVLRKKPPLNYEALSRDSVDFGSYVMDRFRNSTLFISK